MSAPTSIVSALLPEMGHPERAGPILAAFTLRAEPKATFVAPSSEHATMRFEVPAEKAIGFAESIRSIGLTSIEIDGTPFVPLLCPVVNDPNLRTPVRYRPNGSAMVPMRLVIEQYSGSSKLECGHIGPRFTGQPVPGRKARCQGCLPSIERQRDIYGQDYRPIPWIVTETDKQG